MKIFETQFSLDSHILGTKDLKNIILQNFCLRVFESVTLSLCLQVKKKMERGGVLAQKLMRRIKQNFRF